jgi:tryptophan synthase alpha chain
MAARGANIVELGVPFSDPMADGPVIQRASERALARGTKLRDILKMVERVRLRTDVPIILFSYFNPLLQFGLERLTTTASEIGVDGVLVTDMVAEESVEFLQAVRSREMDMIFLLAPTSSDERVAKIASLASGFIYAVSRTGITGVRQNLSEAIEPLIGRIKKSTELPVAVGFGISNREHVQEVWRVAEGAVVGSRIVSEIENCRERDKLVPKIGELISSLRGD